MLLLLKDTLSIEDDDRNIHADQSVRLFARAIRTGTPAQSMKISALYHNFLIHYCRDLSYLAYMY